VICCFSLTQVYSEDDKNAEEMHWQEDAYYQDNFEDEDDDGDFRPHEMLSAYALVSFRMGRRGGPPHLCC